MMVHFLRSLSILAMGTVLAVPAFAYDHGQHRDGPDGDKPRHGGHHGAPMMKFMSDEERADLIKTFPEFKTQIETFKDMSREERRAWFKSLTPEQREKFRKHGRERWEGMSKAEKLKVIEEKHQKRLEYWNSLSDDDKIEKFERHMHHRFRRGHHSGENDSDREGSRDGQHDRHDRDEE